MDFKNQSCQDNKFNQTIHTMNKTILLDANHTFIIEGKIFQQMKQLLDKFNNKKIILTNANDEERKKKGITNMPYEVFSLNHNPNKTDPKYFLQMLNHFSLLPRDVVYFEHCARSVESAKLAGILAVYHYDESKKDLASLEKFLISHLGPPISK